MVIASAWTQASEPSAATDTLFEAVERNDLAAVQSSVENGAAIESRNAFGLRAVDVAIGKGHYAIAHYLLSVHNADRGEPPAVDAGNPPIVAAAEPAIEIPPPPPPTPVAEPARPAFEPRPEVATTVETTAEETTPPTAAVDHPANNAVETALPIVPAQPAEGPTKTVALADAEPQGTAWTRQAAELLHRTSARVRQAVGALDEDVDRFLGGWFFRWIGERLERRNVPQPPSRLAAGSPAGTSSTASPTAASLPIPPLAVPTPRDEPRLFAAEPTTVPAPVATANSASPPSAIEPAIDEADTAVRREPEPARAAPPPAAAEAEQNPAGPLALAPAHLDDEPAAGRSNPVPTGVPDFAAERSPVTAEPVDEGSLVSTAPAPEPAAPAEPPKAKAEESAMVAPQPTERRMTETEGRSTAKPKPVAAPRPAPKVAATPAPARAVPREPSPFAPDAVAPGTLHPVVGRLEDVAPAPAPRQAPTPGKKRAASVEAAPTSADARPKTTPTQDPLDQLAAVAAPARKGRPVDDDADGVFGLEGPDGDRTVASRSPVPMQQTSHTPLSAAVLTLGETAHLTAAMPPESPDPSERDFCVEKEHGAVVFCVEPVDWPAKLAQKLRVSSIMYQGARAIVRYDNGAATRLQAIFPTESYGALVSYYTRRFGQPSVKEVRTITPFAQPRQENNVVSWQRTDPLSNQRTTLEIRAYDDSRGGFPDLRYGVVMLYNASSPPIFPVLSTLDLMPTSASN